MNTEEILQSQKVLDEFYKETLSKIKSQSHSDFSKQTYFLVAEYLLLEAEEYIEGAWQMLLLKRYNASLSLSRWILEASMNLVWVVSNKDKIDERLKILGGEALRCEANLREAFIKIWPGSSSVSKMNAENARRVRDSLEVEKPNDLFTRLSEIKKENPTLSPLEDLYSFYKFCCDAAHPTLKLWEHSTKETHDPNWKYGIASWMIKASTFYLGMFTLKLTGLDDKDQLNDWFKKLY